MRSPSSGEVSRECKPRQLPDIASHDQRPCHTGEEPADTRHRMSRELLVVTLVVRIPARNVKPSTLHLHWLVRVARPGQTQEGDGGGLTLHLHWLVRGAALRWLVSGTDAHEKHRFLDAGRAPLQALTLDDEAEVPKWNNQRTEVRAAGRLLGDGNDGAEYRNTAREHHAQFDQLGAGAPAQPAVVL